jgi:hypothetical protein
MLTLLAALIAGPAGGATTRNVPPIPPIQVTLNNGGNYAPGGLVNVRVETADDGYLIVFRVDGDGRIRVLFPLDPGADAFVRGGKEYELRGRGDRATFLADDRGGTGMIYAALAHQSFSVGDFALNGHWNYDALRLPDSTTDAENDLTAIVARMTNRARFDYDAMGYRVQDIATVGSVAPVGGYYSSLYDPYYNPRWRCLTCGWGYPGADINVGFGYSPFWDPWLYSPWGYTYGYGFGYGYTGTNWWYGNPVIVVGGRPVPQVPPGTRSRPRAEPPQTITNVNGPTRTSDAGRNRPVTNAPPTPPATTGRTAPPAANPGTRARPRPSDIAVTTAPSATPNGTYTQGAAPSVRPVFRQPQGDQMPQPRQDQPQSRPVYREPPRQMPPPPPPPSPPRSAPVQPSSTPSQARPSSPPPPPASTTSRPRGGGR